MLRRVGWRESTDFPEDPTVSSIQGASTLMTEAADSC